MPPRYAECTNPDCGWKRSCHEFFSREACAPGIDIPPHIKCACGCYRAQHLPRSEVTRIVCYVTPHAPAHLFYFVLSNLGIHPCPRFIGTPQSAAKCSSLFTPERYPREDLLTGLRPLQLPRRGLVLLVAKGSMCIAEALYHSMCP